MAATIKLDDSNDFGFTFHDEKDVVAETGLNDQLNTLNDRASVLSKEGKEALLNLQKLILPLLNNLAQNPEKSYIQWPNRVAQIDSFKQKIDTLVTDAIKKLDA